jgi:hypothetical protein
MALTGERLGPPCIAPAAVASCADAAIDVLATLAVDGSLDAVSGARLLGERAAIAGLSRNGAVSVGASCRILRARNGWIAVN